MHAEVGADAAVRVDWVVGAGRARECVGRTFALALGDDHGAQVVGIDPGVVLAHPRDVLVRDRSHFADLGGEVVAARAEEDLRDGRICVVCHVCSVSHKAIWGWGEGAL